jgi:hypothetical protein
LAVESKKHLAQFADRRRAFFAVRSLDSAAKFFGPYPDGATSIDAPTNTTHDPSGVRGRDL